MYGNNSVKKLSQKVVRILSKNKLNISFVESCTGGLLSSAITSVSGSSKIFSLGLITYSNEAKIRNLKVPKKILNKFGAVSSETCLCMVNNLNKIAKTSISLSITGIAGPKGGTKKKPVGLVYIGIKKSSKVKVLKFIFKNKNRQFIQRSTANKALRLILQFAK